MGFMSQKIFPACGNMCVCCPALRSRSRQPVKRYKKLLAEIFPKSPIAKYLEERCCKELRSEHIKYVKIVSEVYNKLLSICKEQMAYFAVNLLNLVIELLDNSKRNMVQMIGCQTLTRFIYSQVDGTYTHNIESLVPKVCLLAHQTSEEHQNRCLQASSLQCISSMVWYMAEFSHIFVEFDKIVKAILDNYETDRSSEGDVARREANHNWVNEVVRCEGQGGAGAGNEINASCVIIRPRPEKRDPCLLTREEVETPKVWVQICLQRMVELAKESTTMRLILDPMFVYFDMGQHWVGRHGLALMVLSDMSYYMEYPGHQQFLLTAVVRHLDHKNVSHDPKIKSDIIQTATALARQIRSSVVLSDIGFVNDLCRHMRKSLQASVDSVGEQELNLNIILQNSIEDCLLETARGIADVRPLFDMMAISLESLPITRVYARATIRSLMVVADMISLATSKSQQVFPEALLVQLLKAMLHADLEVRVGAHHIFSVLLIPKSNHHGYDNSTRTRRWRSSTESASASASISSLLEKLRREKDGNKGEKDGNKVEKQGSNAQDCLKERDNAEEDWKQGWARKNSPNLHTLSTIIDRTAGSNSSAEAEPPVVTLNEDQITQLLSAFFLQANLSDNLPSDIEAIAHSFCLTLLSSRLKSSSGNLVVRFFQLPLSLRKLSLDPDHGIFSSVYQRSLLILSTAMLQLAAKLYQIPHVNDLLKSSLRYDVDPYVGISNDFQVFVKPLVNVGEYGSSGDNQGASFLLSELRKNIFESENIMLDILSQSLSKITKMEANDLVQQLSEGFVPDDTFMFGPQSMIDMDHVQAFARSKGSLSFDGDFPSDSSGDDDVTSESSVADFTNFIPKLPASPSMSHIISIGQLLESALEVAGQVAGTTVSTSPLPFSAMASQCQTLGTDTRKKLTNWLSSENHQQMKSISPITTIPVDEQSSFSKIMGEDEPVGGALLTMESRLALRLPPASPFDNFLRAARQH
ncbi:protein SEMI-ROLLED LEAF 2 isoform X2 [Daucus carota subsp. sativus]|uniref:protein SEMI-ROLLED LEAF 2 isoform X2 n=1 Tax=Daucus carota subsp. sativus TaxID=79200 RepID=UPI0030828217